jgi:predicted flap endonuclease-1-like 5' DNA nuclease
LETADGGQMVFQPSGAAVAAGTDTTAVQDDATGGFLGLPWWAWLLLAVLLLLLLWWLFGRRPVPPPPPEPPRRVMTPEPPPARPTLPEPTPMQSVTPEMPSMSTVTPETPPTPPMTPERPLVEPMAPEPPSLSTRDDLKRIEGIGPRIEGILNNAGVTTFRALSATTAERLREILVASDLRGAYYDPTTWPEQAQLAAEDKWAELEAMQAGLKGGRRS